MKEKSKIHVLVNELILLYDDLEDDAKTIVDEHISKCEDCKRQKKLIYGTQFFEQEEDSFEDGKTLPIFKKLVYFKGIIISLFIVMRLILLFVIARHWDLEEIGTLVNVDLSLYYLPFVTLMNAVLFLFYRRLLFWLLLGFDILVLIYFQQFYVFVFL